MGLHPLKSAFLVHPVGILAIFGKLPRVLSSRWSKTKLFAIGLYRSSSSLRGTFSEAKDVMGSVYMLVRKDKDVTTICR